MIQDRSLAVIQVEMLITQVDTQVWAADRTVLVPTWQTD